MSRMKRLSLVMAIGGLLLVGCARRTTDGGEGVPRGQGGVMGSCVERYTAENVSARQVAFDGTVADIRSVPASETAPEGEQLPDESEVTFTVSRWFKGGSGGSVTMKSSVPIGSVSSADFPSIEKGKRYLVSGDGGFMWACGFTRDYSDVEAQQWAEAFGTTTGSYNPGTSGY